MKRGKGEGECAHGEICSTSGKETHPSAARREKKDKRGQRKHGRIHEIFVRLFGNDNLGIVHINGKPIR